MRKGALAPWSPVTPHKEVTIRHVASGLELQNPYSTLENVGPCTWVTGLAVAGPLLWVARDLLSGLLAEGQEEVIAQWLGKVHLQVCPHEQLEDIIADCLRRDTEGRVKGETERRERRRRVRGAGRRETYKGDRRKWRGCGGRNERPVGEREPQAQEDVRKRTHWQLPVRA